MPLKELSPGARGTELPTTLGTVCRKVAKALEGFEGFHFHQLRHTYTSNLLANGAAPKDGLYYGDCSFLCGLCHPIAGCKIPYFTPEAEG